MTVKISVTKFSDNQYCEDENSVRNPSLNMICDGIVTKISTSILVFPCSVSRELWGHS